MPLGGLSAGLFPRGGVRYAVGYALENLRVLVAEDNPHFAELLRLVLRSLGVRHQWAVDDGIAAFQHFKQTPVDLIVTDFAMEPIGGIELLKLIRHSPESRDRFIPVIVMTGYTELEHIEAARDAGATEILAKPFTPKHLAVRLESIIERPRPFYETADFFGPNRRRHVDPAYKGPERRVAATAGVVNQPT